MTALAVAATAVATGLAVSLSLLRWLRVAQREHYLPGSVARFAVRWWRSARNLPLAGAALVGAVAVWWLPAAGLVTAVAVAAGPIGLGVKGRTSKPAWTRRLRTLAGVAVAVGALCVGVGAASGRVVPVAALVALTAPLLVEIGLYVTRPVEARLGRRWVDRAAARLRAEHPRTVAVTGSYGKTTTKRYLAHLLRGSHTVLETPASFNNAMGLARTVNEHMAPGTEVFVAEMGTYGPGEIRDLCRWVQPEVSVITAVGPVHLERMRSIETVVRAKSEILDHAEVAVLNVDHPELEEPARAFPRRVVRCSTSPATRDVDVRVVAAGDRFRIDVSGRVIEADVAPGTHPANLACALGAALALDVPLDALADRLATLPVTDHRLQVLSGPTGVTVVDDTFNANPAGARAALDLLSRLASPARPAGGRAVVVTPGMVELGPVQAAENEQFARAAGEVATDLVIVGETNRAALLAGASQAGIPVHRVRTREQAVAWVRATLGEGDVVLYENDLPDHYP